MDTTATPQTKTAEQLYSDVVHNVAGALGCGKTVAINCLNDYPQIKQVCSLVASKQLEKASTELQTLRATMYENLGFALDVPFHIIVHSVEGAALAVMQDWV